MAEAQFDLCFDLDWDSSGSTKDPNYNFKLLSLWRLLHNNIINKIIILLVKTMKILRK